MAYIGKQPTPVPLSVSDLDDDIITLAKMAGGTDGNLITYDTSGNPVAVATGSDGQVLTSAGAGNPCLFEAAASGGKILQVVSVEKSNVFSTTSTSFVDITDLDVDITPAATSSKILVMYTTAIGCATAVNGAYLRLMRDSTVIFEGTQTDSLVLGVRHARVTATGELYPASGSMVDSPSSTSAINYGLELRSHVGAATTANAAAVSPELLSSSSIVAIEIGA